MEGQFPPGQENKATAFGRKHQTGLVTLLFTDMVGSTALKQQLGDQVAAGHFRKHHELLRDTLRHFPKGEEIETAGDSFLLVFATPSDAVQFALVVQARFRSLQVQGGLGLSDRIGIHVGEVVIEHSSDSAKPRDLFGIQIDTCARVMSLARAGQILMTRSVFDSARQALKGGELPEVAALTWLNHGPYLLKGLDEPVEICEVREQGQPLGAPPTGSEKAQRQVRPDEEPVLGWRPAVGQSVPNTRWVLERKLGEGGFGEVWLGRNPTTKEPRVFKFCFHAERVRFLKRELTLFRLLKERVGDHPNIVRLHDVYVEQPPFYVEMDYVEGADLRTWWEARNGNTQPLEVGLAIVAQAADALQAAHEAGIIHRDIKPANILVSVQSWMAPNSAPAGLGSTELPSSRAPRALRVPLVKLTDFGIGQVVSDEYLKGITRAGFTQTILAESSSSRTGTHLYMAPELLGGKPASTRSDLYSLGVVLYQLIVGDFTRPVTMDWPKDITDPLLVEDLKLCFAGNPQDRFPAAAQLASHLRNRSERQAALAERLRGARRRALTRIVSATTVLLLLFAVALGYGLLQAKRETLRARQSLYAAEMSLAGEALDADNLAETRFLLEPYRTGKPDLRGWEWRYAWHRSKSDERARVGSHASEVEGLEFSPDGCCFVTLSRDKTAKLWPTAGVQFPSTNLDLNAEPVYGALAFSPDSRTVAVGSDDGRLWLWDIATGGTTNWFAGPVLGPGVTKYLVFLPGDQVLASAEPVGICLWDIKTGSRTAVIPGSEFATSLAVSRDGNILAAGRREGYIQLWHAHSWAPLPSIAVPIHHHFGISFSPDGTKLATSDTEGNLAVWDRSAGRAVFQTKLRGWISAARFTPDGKMLVTSGVDQKIHFWDTVSWEPKGQLQGAYNEIWAMACAPDGQMLVTGAKDGTIKTWAASAPTKPPNGLAVPGADNNTAALAPDGRAFVWWPGGRFLQLLTLGDPFASNNVPLQVVKLSKVAVASGGGLIAVASNTGSAHLVQSASGSEIAVIAGSPTNLVTALRFSNDGQLLAIGSQDGVIRFVNTGNGNVQCTLRDSNSGVFSLTFSRSGKQLAAGTDDGAVWLWDIKSKPPSGRVLLPRRTNRVVAVAFSPDETLLGAAAWDESLTLWDVLHQRQLKFFKSFLRSFQSVAFSQDGRRIAAGTGDGPVKMWDTSSYHQVATLGGQEKSVFDLEFQDDDTLVTAHQDGIEVWRAPLPPAR